MAGYPRRGAATASPHRQGLIEISDASLACGEAFEHGAGRFEDRHAPVFPALGRFGDKASLAGAYLLGDCDEVLVESDISDLQP